MLTLAILGQTGSGKTSLSNALFGVDWETDPAVSCTQEVSRHEGRMLAETDKHPGWRLLDTPGVGESEDADDRHFQQIYLSFHAADVVLWVVQADTRAFREDQEAILRLTDQGQKTPEAHFVIALNQVDRIYPENWDAINNVPSPEQVALIPEKTTLVHQRFSSYLPISQQHIIPCSVLRNYGLAQLVEALSLHAKCAFL